MDRRAWRAVVHRVTKSGTGLKRLSVRSPLYWAGFFLGRSGGTHLSQEFCVHAMICFILFFNIYLLIWLYWVLVVAHGVFDLCCGVQTLS